MQGNGGAGFSIAAAGYLPTSDAAFWAVGDSASVAIGDIREPFGGPAAPANRCAFSLSSLFPFSCSYFFFTAAAAKASLRQPTVLWCFLLWSQVVMVATFGLSLGRANTHLLPDFSALSTVSFALPLVSFFLMSR